MQLGVAYDASRALLVLARAEANHDAHHQGFIDAVKRLDADAAALGMHGVCILLTTPNTPAPPAAWRQKFAESALAHQSRELFFAVVTASAIQRGVLTVIGWLTGERRVSVSQAFETFELAMAAAEKARGEALPELRALRTRAERMLAESTKG